MDKLKTYLILIIFLSSFCFAKTQQEEYKNDILYSQEYFDYLIECASYDLQEKTQEENFSVDKENEISIQETEEDVISDNFEPFKLRIENKPVSKYTELFKKEDTKTIIPVTSRFSLAQNTTKFKNKYNSNDYKISAGGEYKLNRFINISSGLESNYRNLDQNPISKKLYITPTLKIKDRISVSFYNTLNTQTKASEHDISLSYSPLKSGRVNLGVYAGFTQNNSGKTSESLSFSTHLFF